MCWESENWGISGLQNLAKNNLHLPLMFTYSSGSSCSPGEPHLETCLDMKTSEFKSAAANPSSLHPELALNSLQTQPGLFPVMHLVMPPPQSISPSFCNSLCKQKPKQHFPASLMKFLAELFVKIKFSLKTKRLWEGMRSQLFISPYRCDRTLWNLQPGQDLIFLCVNKMFPKLTKFFCKTIKWTYI